MKKLPAFLLAACMLTSTVPGVLAAEPAAEHPSAAQAMVYPIPEPRDVSASGDVTETVHWTLEGGVLTVSGTGEIPDAADAWDAYRMDVTEIRVEPGITRVGAWAFQDMANAKKATVAGSVQSVGMCAFFEAVSLTDLTLGEGVEELEDYALGYTALETLTLPASLRVWSEAALECLPHTERFEVQPGNPALSSVDGVLFADGGTTLVRFPERRNGAYAVPEGTVRIAASAFSSALLEGITLPDTLREIGANAFGGACSLTEITIPEGVTELRADTFAGNGGLRDVCLPSTMLRIHCTAIPFESTRVHTEKCPELKRLPDGSYVRDASARFTDVPANAWYADAAAWALDRGVTNGASETTFSPESPCTRAQAVAFLWRASGSPEPKDSASFADVQPGSYYEKAVCWAVENGVTNGTDATHFAPDAPCTRAQVVTLLHRCSGEMITPLKCSFEDVSDSDWFAKAVDWAVSARITNGMDETHFAPNDSCTRAQIVTFLFRAQCSGCLKA